MRKVILASLVMFLIGSNVIAQKGDYGGLNNYGLSTLITMPYSPYAKPGGTAAIWTNPAGIGVDGGSGLLFMNPFISGADEENGFQNDWGIGVNLGHLGFGAERVTGNKEATRYSWGSSMELSEGFNIGFAYHWSSGDLDRQNSYDIGMLVRPTRWLSLGGQVTEVGRPKYNGVRQDPTYHLGLALRPIGHRLTLTADATIWKGYYTDPDDDSNISLVEYDDKFDLTFGAEWMATENLALRGGYSLDSEIVFAGMSVYGGHLSLNGYSASRSHTQHDGAPDNVGVGWLRMSSEWRPSLTDLFQPKKVVTLKLKGTIVEEPEPFSFFRKRNMTLLTLLNKIERLRKDPNVTGVLLEIENFSIRGSDRLEFRDALQRFRDEGKKVVVYLEDDGLGNYFLASVADRIIMHPGGGLIVTGLFANQFYLKGTLDKIGIDVQFARAGKYKSAAEILTSDGMSQPARESLDAVVETIWQTILEGIAEGRGVSKQQVINWIDQATYTPDEALEAGLVDAIAYDDELQDEVEVAFGDESIRTVAAGPYFSREIAEYEWEDMTSPKIAIIYATGDILRGESSSRGGLFGGRKMGSSSITKAIRKARSNPRVKAIVLRVESGGGTGYASDIIQREIEKTTNEDLEGRHIPLIVSFSDAAASGGYHISCKADTIVAPVTCITGSIGVLGGKFVTKELSDKIGITYDGVRRGKNANFWSITEKWDDEQMENVQHLIDEYYQDFITHVAEGRGMDTTQVNEVAQGRIWSGADAKEIGLVDVNGGFLTAIEIAKEAAGLENTTVVDLECYPGSSRFELKNEMRAMVLDELPISVQQALKADTFIKAVESGEPLLISPVSAEDMLGGE